MADRRAFLGFALLGTLSAASGAGAEDHAPTNGTRLVMFDAPGCGWCAQWRAEVGIIYARTPEGARAPLLRLDIRDGAPEGVTIAPRPVHTPTFVLIDDGREVGRILGYPGEAFFWGLLGRLLERLPDHGTAS